MKHPNCLRIYALLFTILLLSLHAVRIQRTVTPKEYATQVLDQYMKYYCPTSGICTRKKALQKLRRDWPHVYQLGFQVLENDEK